MRRLTLKQQIKKMLAKRVIVAFSLVFTLLALTAINDIRNSYLRMEEHLLADFNTLSSYIIEQSAISNYSGVKEKLISVNGKNKFTVKVVNQNLPLAIKGFHYQFPFHWYYYKKLSKMGLGNYGYMYAFGSILSNHELVNSFFYKAVLFLLVLSISIYLILPILGSLPNKLIIYPILNILNLLEREAKSNSLEETRDYQSAVEILEIEKRISEILLETKKIVKVEALASLASQVAHDIRSPLAALNTLLSNISSLPEKQRQLVRSATNRINDIANNLLSQYKAPEGEDAERNVSTHLLYTCIDSILSEKRALLRPGIELHFLCDKSAYFSTSSIDQVEFSRILSNVINNAVEAILKTGPVSINLSCDGEKVKLEVMDTGCGILPKNLPHVFEKGKSFGKESGHGLGLYHAKQIIKGWGGSIEIMSKLNCGTSVIISLPSASPPAWLAQKLQLPKGGSVIIVDDDESIHHIWDQKLGNNVKKIHLHKASEFDLWAKENNEKLDQAAFLFDYELIGDHRTGIDLIKQYGLHYQSTLVTSRYEDESIIRFGEQNGVLILPKSLSCHVPIVWLCFEPDYIFIDDDKSLCSVWELQASIANKTLYTFNHLSDFERVEKYFSRTTPIYIDSNLADGVKGEVASEEYSKRGFTDICLATGDARVNISGKPWIKAVVDKSPPF